MREFIGLYNEHKTEIENFLVETIRNSGRLIHADVDDLRKFFNLFSSLELIYITDENFVQTSPNVCKDSQDNLALGKDRNYLLSRFTGSAQDVLVSPPYISSATGEACVTVQVCFENTYHFFDFNVKSLLSGFGLVEIHPLFNNVTKWFYLSIGVSLMFFSLVSIGYAFYEYFEKLFGDTGYSLEQVFKPIIALTMGLAIFDLAKTLLEREVFFKAYSESTNQSRLLSKFLIAIIIALSIEALMVVFKMGLEDPTQMINGLYLIMGVALIILSLAVYTKLTSTPDVQANANKII